MAPDTDVTRWDVSRWSLGPSAVYRLNSHYRRDDGAIVTATGSFDTPSAIADLTTALRPFTQLGDPVVVDVSHAALSGTAVRTLADIATRRRHRPGGPALVVSQADVETGRRVQRAGATAFALRCLHRCDGAGSFAWW